MCLTPSAYRKSYPSPWRLFLHGALWPTLLSARYARQTSHMDQRSDQHAHKFRPCFRRLTEGEPTSRVQPPYNKYHILMLSMSSLSPVLSRKETETDITSAVNWSGSGRNHGRPQQYLSIPSNLYCHKHFKDFPGHSKILNINFCSVLLTSVVQKRMRFL